MFETTCPPSNPFLLDKFHVKRVYRRMRSRFAEYGYRYSIRLSDLSEGQMAEGYKFYANLFAKDSLIWWTSPGGRCGGGSLDDFFSVLHMDGNYAFGPTKKQSGWPMEKLDEIGAIGVYKKGAAKPKASAKPAPKKSRKL